LDLGSFDLYEVTDRDYFKGFSLDGVKFLPKQLDYFSVMPESENTGTENAHVKVEYQFTDQKQSNQFEAQFKPTDWYPSQELESIKTLIPTLVSVTATAFSIKLEGFDGVPYTGAVKEDIYLRKGTENGTLIAITSLTPSTTIPGNYTGVIGTQTSGTYYFGLLPQPEATTLGVETETVASLIVTI
jgi:hypothetical protein